MPDPQPPALGVAAKGIVRRADGAVLLIRRSPRSATDPGAWDLPGGKMDYGERLVDTLVRETREECGIDVTPGVPVHVTAFVKEPFWVTSVGFTCTTSSDVVRLGDEHTEYEWVPILELAGRRYARGIEEHLDAFVALVAREP